MKPTLRTALIIWLLFTSFSLLKAQPGTLDSSFGVNGKVTENFATIRFGSDPIAIQADGKIVVAATFEYGITQSYFVLSRFNTNGSIDSSFGSNGKVNTLFDTGYYTGAVATCITIQNDNKILVGGYVYHPFIGPDYFAISRYMPNGNLDSTFGNNGKEVDFIGPFPKENEIFSVALQADGKIIADGNSDGYCVVRYKSNGILDSSFAVNGILRTQNMIYSGLTTVHLQSDGKIVTGENVLDFSTYYSNFGVTRLLPSGLYDSSFGINGQVLTDFYGNIDNLYSVAILNNGSIIAAGGTIENAVNGSYIALVKYNINGKIDSTFGSNGKVTTKLGETGVFANKVMEQEDGKLIISGQTDAGNVLVARFKANGTIDSSFGINGKSVFNFSAGTYSHSAALQKDGKIICLADPGISLARVKGDDPITVSLRKNISVTEGNTGLTPAVFQVVLSKASSLPVKVNFKTLDGTAIKGSDYKNATGTVTIKAGKLSASVTVNVIGDAVKEPNETFSLIIANPVNATLGSMDTATCLIKNDDAGFAADDSNTDDVQTAGLGIKVYPNPVKEILNIEGLHAATKTNISIFDIQGNAIIKATTGNSNFAVNVKKLAPGTYYVKIDSGIKTETIKFIKE